MYRTTQIRFTLKFLVRAIRVRGISLGVSINLPNPPQALRFLPSLEMTLWQGVFVFSLCSKRCSGKEFLFMLTQVATYNTTIHYK